MKWRRLSYEPDVVVVDRAVLGGDFTGGTVAERREAVRRLTNIRLSLTEIAFRLHTTPRTISRDRRWLANSSDN